MVEINNATKSVSYYVKGLAVWEVLADGKKKWRGRGGRERRRRDIEGDESLGKIEGESWGSLKQDEE